MFRDRSALTLPAVVRNGVVETAANIDPVWIGTDAVELFGEATGRAVGVVNDADAAGLAEMRYGAGKGRQGVVIVSRSAPASEARLFANGTLVPNTELGHLHASATATPRSAAESVREREDLRGKIGPSASRSISVTRGAPLAAS